MTKVEIVVAKRALKPIAERIEVIGTEKSLALSVQLVDGTQKIFYDLEKVREFIREFRSERI